MRYQPIEVYMNNRFSDCTANGISVTHTDKLVIETEDGFMTEEMVAEKGYKVLELVKRNIGAQEYIHFKEKGDKRHTMFGGNFAYSSDSRFSKLSRYPIAIHDRYEG